MHKNLKKIAANGRYDAQEWAKTVFITDVVHAKDFARRELIKAVSRARAWGRSAATAKSEAEKRSRLAFYYRIRTRAARWAGEYAGYANHLAESAVVLDWGERDWINE